jgi:hypothetical protein
MRLIHEFEPMLPEDRPQDPYGDGTGLTFTTAEHGGEYPDMMPQADGRVVKSKRFSLERGNRA